MLLALSLLEIRCLLRPLLVYIHGFQSSPLSQKAEETRRYVLSQSLPFDFLAPALDNYPMRSYQQLQAVVERHLPRPIALIASSLGGFMATALSEQYGLRAVLVNPAVRPYELISAVLGDNVNPYTGIKFCLDESHIDELHQLEVITLSDPSRIKVLIQTGDETLDYRQAVSYYQGCEQVIEEGGDHRFQNYEKHLPEVIKFLTLIT
jgi:predicted esterase YcpF (UPF0227 family)